MTPALRKSALFVFLAGTLASIEPVHRLIESLREYIGGEPPTWWVLLFGALIVVLSVVTWIFYLVLFLNRSPLTISPRLRQLSRAMAAIIALMEIPKTGTLVSDGVSVPGIFSMLGDVSVIVRMTAFFCYPELTEPVAPLPRLLRIATWAALVATGLFLAQAFIQLASSPITSSSMQSRSIAAGVTCAPTGGRFGSRCRIFRRRRRDSSLRGSCFAASVQVPAPERTTCPNTDA